MAKTKAHRIKEAALIAGVSVRTLHYYDEIKLLTPSDRSAAGYRMYDDSDLLRLQQILIGRSLGLALEDIRRSLDDPADHEEEVRTRWGETNAYAQSAKRTKNYTEADLQLFEQQRARNMCTRRSNKIQLAALSQVLFQVPAVSGSRCPFQTGWRKWGPSGFTAVNSRRRRQVPHQLCDPENGRLQSIQMSYELRRRFAP